MLRHGCRRHGGARAGSRTLNLGIKSLSTRRLKDDQRGSGRLNRTRIHDATVSESLLESQGVSRSRCQKRRELEADSGVGSRLDSRLHFSDQRKLGNI